jgi:hypothetical protein
LLVGLIGLVLARRRYARRWREAERRAEASAQQAASSARRAAEAMQATHALQGMHATGGAMAGLPMTATGVAVAHGGASAARRPAAERVGEVVRRDLDGAAMVLSAWLGEDGELGNGERHGRGEASTGGTLS